MQISNDAKSLENSESLYPVWSLILVFVLTLSLCACVAICFWMYKKCQERRISRKFSRNSGKVSVGRRTTVRSMAETDFTSPDDGIACVTITHSTHPDPRSERPNADRVGNHLIAASTLYPLIIAGARLNELSIASGAYASVSSYERKDMKQASGDLGTVGSTASPAATSTRSDPSYFTPVFCRQSVTSQAKFSSPGSLLFCEAVRKHLSSVFSTVSGDDNEEGAYAGAVKSLKNAEDLAGQVTNVAESECSIHQVLDIGNNNCTYLTFNDMSVIITPPVSSGKHKTMAIPSSQLEKA